MKPKQTLEDLLTHKLEEYFKELDGANIGNIYNLVKNEVDRSLIKVTLKITKNNQSKASKWLGISRNTLKKLILKASQF